MAHSVDVLLNDFAIRCFRDTADHEYIVARLAHRSRLAAQFLWSSLHALEKYAKCILIINRISSAKPIGHTVTPALDLINANARFKITLSAGTLEFIRRLERGAERRYLEVSHYTLPLDLQRLDLAVWEIRRYCQALDWKIWSGEQQTDLFPRLMGRLIADTEAGKKGYCISNGRLEKILKDRKHPARAALVWQNLYAGSSTRRKVFSDGWSHAENAPLTLHPQILDEVVKYGFFPRKLEKLWRAELAAIAKGSTARKM